ncbi:hypothetical protein WA026_011039 [Henosepilachna vigintioctopunctata]|uniref:Lipocalin/cytosolic fatty-acid binding domain-containing protein n=1 Tax=Henosepilachna vigintioctopunctata TaxID=420089 RepID=A0AAW1TWI5_9CUCU
MCEQCNILGAKVNIFNCSVTDIEFLGVWYALEANDDKLSCTTFTFKTTEKPLKYNIEESGPIQLISIIKHFYARFGKAKIEDVDYPANMAVKWNWMYPPEDLVIFETDYNNYAGVLFCSKLGLASQTRIFVLSRETNLTQENTQKVKDSLQLNQYSVKEFSPIKHKDCPKSNSNNTFKIKIFQDTLTPKSLGRNIEKLVKDNFGEKHSSEEKNESQESVTTIQP